MSVAFVGEFTLGEVNVAASGAVALVAPLLAQTDLMLMGPFGLGALQADLAAQFNAALAAQISLGLQIANPFAALAAQLQAILQIQASIAATIALGIPAVSATLAATLSASVAISGTLNVRVGGLQALIAAALNVKLPTANFVGGLAANLPAGPFVLLSVGYTGGDTLSSSGVSYNLLAQSGVGGLAPSDPVFGVIILTKSPSASAALAATIRTT